jgi:hypothetical protein
MPRYTEHAEQVALITWARLSQYRLPELRLLHAIPNGGQRSKAQAGKLKAEGVLAGIPDLFLPVAREPRHGLYIEMKGPTTGVPTTEQWEVMRELALAGYAVCVARGWDKAVDAVERYLAGRWGYNRVISLAGPWSDRERTKYAGYCEP